MWVWESERELYRADAAFAYRSASRIPTPCLAGCTHSKICMESYVPEGKETCCGTSFC